MKCQECGKEKYMPFKCPHCNGTFCVEHRLPENHNCKEYWRAQSPREALPRAPSSSRTDYSYEHKVTVGPPRRHLRITWLSSTEFKHFLIGLFLTLAIGLSLPLYGAQWLYNSPEIIAILATIFAFSFITHELAHKLTAQHYGLWAEFRITSFGALITLLSIVSPFKIISPGAVMIRGVANLEVIGKTSISGPLTNITWAVLFLLLGTALRAPTITYFATSINSFIALFNLIPFGILDGSKVFYWNRKAWILAFSISVLITIFSYLFFP